VTGARAQGPAAAARGVCAALLAWIALAAALPAAERAPGHAAIASAHPLATAAGREILAKGGNAFDAAVAVAAALAVVEPSASGLGGGGFFLLHRARDGLDVMIDAREKAPGAATRDMFLDKAGDPVPRLSTDSALAAGIPGEVAGLGWIARKYGHLPLAADLQPAIRLAREGFPMYRRLQASVGFKLQALKDQAEAARVFLHDGAPPELGFIIKQPELAETLSLIAREGSDAFYKGAFAHRLVEGVRGLGGIWSEADLAAYRALERAPIVGQYRGARIVSASPPASGGIALLDALRDLAAQRDDLAGVYLETATEANVPYYSAHGYQVVGEMYPLGVKFWRMFQAKRS